MKLFIKLNNIILYNEDNNKTLKNKAIKIRILSQENMLLSEKVTCDYFIFLYAKYKHLIDSLFL